MTFARAVCIRVNIDCYAATKWMSDYTNSRPCGFYTSGWSIFGGEAADACTINVDPQQFDVNQIKVALTLQSII